MDMLGFKFLFTIIPVGRKVLLSDKASESSDQTQSEGLPRIIVEQVMKVTRRLIVNTYVDRFNIIFQYFSAF